MKWNQHNNVKIN